MKSYYLEYGRITSIRSIWETIILLQQYLNNPSSVRTSFGSSPSAVLFWKGSNLSATTCPHEKHLTGVNIFFSNYKYHLLILIVCETNLDNKILSKLSSNTYDGSSCLIKLELSRSPRNNARSKSLALSRLPVSESETLTSVIKD